MQVRNPELRKKTKKVLFPICLGILALFFFIALFLKTQWWIDALLSAGLLLAIIFLNRWLHPGKTGFILVFIGLLIHNIGAFGAYALTFGPFGYDNVVHFFSAAIAAYVAFSFVSHRLHVKEHKTRDRTVVDDHVPLLILLVLALVALLGVVVELLEFSGYVFLGQGDGILFDGSGDQDVWRGNDGNYMDTMTDIIANTLGSILGVFGYFFFTYRYMPWLKYT